MSQNEPGTNRQPTIADHAATLKNLTQEAREHPDRLEQILEMIDHTASAIAAIAAIT